MFRTYLAVPLMSNGWFALQSLRPLSRCLNSKRESHNIREALYIRLPSCLPIVFSFSAQVPDRRRRGQRPRVHPVGPSRSRPQPLRRRRPHPRRERRLRRKRQQQEQFVGGKLKLEQQQQQRQCRLPAVGADQAGRVAVPAHRPRGGFIL